MRRPSVELREMQNRTGARADRTDGSQEYQMNYVEEEKHWSCCGLTLRSFAILNTTLLLALIGYIGYYEYKRPSIVQTCNSMQTTLEELGTPPHTYMLTRTWSVNKTRIVHTSATRTLFSEKDVDRFQKFNTTKYPELEQRILTAEKFVVRN